MNWQDQIKAYEHRINDKSTDDMICRRMWKSLGLSGSYSTSKLAGLEKSLGIYGNHELVDVERMIYLFKYSIKEAGGYFPFKMTACKIRKFDDIVEKIAVINSDDEIVKLLTAMALPIFIARVANTDMVLVYIVYPTDHSKFQLVCPCSFFKIPMSIQKATDNLCVIAQELEDLVEPLKLIHE